MARGRYRPTPREAALLVLSLIAVREQQRGPLTRLRIGNITLRRLANRHVLASGFVAELADWLHGAGWVLFRVGGTGFAAVRVGAVRNWPTVASTTIQGQLESVVKGDFDFCVLEGLVPDAELDLDEGR